MNKSPRREFAPKIEQQKMETVTGQSLDSTLLVLKRSPWHILAKLGVDLSSTCWGLNLHGQGS